MDKKVMLYGGILLIIIALILGVVQHFNVYNIYGASDNKWYFYGVVAIIGIIGIIMAAMSVLKKETPPPTQSKGTS